MNSASQPTLPGEPRAIRPLRLAVLLWAAGWTVAAGCAAVAVWERATAASIIALAWTGAIAIGAIRVGRTGVIQRRDAAFEPPAGPAEGLARRVVGWIAVVVWSTIGVVWNVAILGTIARLAREGRGFSIAFATLWAFVGLIPLAVTVVSVQQLFGWLFRFGSSRRLPTEGESC